MRRRLLRFLATGFGTGCAPRLRGTIGTLGAAGVYLGLAHLGWVGPWTALAWAAAWTVIAVPLGTWAQGDFGEKDPPPFVLDEFAGLFLSTVAVDLGAPWKTALGAFLLFRLFDIAKPPPCRRLEDLPGGWGIVLDDLAAALYANGILHLYMALG